jgi:hypothetical protein
MNATAAALVRANGVVAAAVLRRQKLLFGGHQIPNAVTAPLRSGGGSGGRARAVAGTTARLANAGDAAAMDAKEAERRGAVVADAELKPATFAELAKGEVPLSVDGKVALKGMRYTELEQWLTSIEARPSRATQIWAWMYRHGKLVDGVQHMEVRPARCFPPRHRDAC